MHIGNVVVAGRADLERLYGAAIGILERVGMRVTHRAFLERLQAYGARVAMDGCTAAMPLKVIEKAVAAMRTATRNQPVSPGPVATEFRVSLGDSCLFFYDYEKRTRRRATRKDFIAAVRFADAVPDIKHFTAPVEIGGMPVKMMVLEMQALSYLHSPKPSSPIESNIPEQTKFLVQLNEVVSNYRETVGAVGNAQGVTSPLTFGDLPAELFLEGGRYGLNSSVYTMPIAGLNAPATIEGCAVQALAELLGAWTCLMSVDESRSVSTMALTGTVDMRTGKACWASPGAIRQNSLVTAVFDEVIGVPINLDFCWYTDAVEPGYQCADDRVMKLLSVAPQAGAASFHVGDLDGASVFSLEQAVIDIDVCRWVHELLKPVTVNEDTMAVREIERMGTEQGRTHLDTDFTLQHFRDSLWMPEVIPHEYWKEDLAGVSEAEVLESAHRRWKSTVENHEPYRPPAQMVRDIERVLAEARTELL